MVRRRRAETCILGLLLLAGFLLFGCASPERPPLPREAGPTKPVWVVAPGWHTGLVIRRGDIPPGSIPESADFPEADYLEFGWGDRDYYRAPDFDLWITLKAALVPTASVLHVAGLRMHPARYFGAPGTVRIDLPEPGFDRLVGYLDASFARRGAARISPLSPGLYGQSGFYEAEGRFHLFNTCNVWIARALKTAGLPAEPGLAITSGGLRCQARHWGTAEPVGAGAQ